jgi:signal transduction histidine kinase
MGRLSDEELMDELRGRFEENRKALFDLHMVTKKLVDLNAKLQQSEALKSDFLSNIRNEVNNPLSAIMGMARQLAGGGVAGDDVAPLAEAILAEAFTLDFQMRNIFSAADLEAGADEPVAARVDVLSVIGDVADSLSQRLREKELRLRICPGGDGDLFFCTDAGKLQTIMANLLANAVEFSFTGGDVTVTAGRQGEQLLIVVADAGIGFDRADAGVIFERFRQLDTGAGKKHKGYGLGLSITRALVELLGGSITVRSRRGEGAVFTVELPPLATAEALDVFAEDGNLFIFDDSARQ